MTSMETSEKRLFACLANSFGFTELTDEEFELYRELTKKIARKLAAQGIDDISDDETDKSRKSLASRKNIIST